MTEKEKMISGEVYNPRDLRLIWDRDRAARILHRVNRSCFHEWDMKNRKLRKLLNTSGCFWIKPPFYCDYGYNIVLGREVMLNYGCVLLDVCPIQIGDKTLIGPHTQLVTACHAIDPQDREQEIEFGKPIVIGRNVWIGAGVIVCPGVTIGENTVIGAGSVVTRPIPANVVAYGNPCTVRRAVTARDRQAVSIDQ